MSHSKFEARQARAVASSSDVVAPFAGSMMGQSVVI